MPDVPATVMPGPGWRVVVDGATVSCPAVVLNDALYYENQRVTVTVRNPQPPVILGVESSGEEAP